MRCYALSDGFLCDFETSRGQSRPISSKKRTSESLPRIEDHGKGLRWSPCVDLTEIGRLIGHRLAIFLHLKCTLSVCFELTCLSEMNYE